MTARFPRRPKVVRFTKARAIQIAMNHNNVSREVAEKYTNSELVEVLRALKIKNCKIVGD